MVTSIIVVTLCAVLFGSAYFLGLNKVIFYVYYAVKYILFKPVEWLVRAVIAFFGALNNYVGIVWGGLLFLYSLILPEKEIKFVWMVVFGICSGIILLRAVHNFCNKDDRNFVRMRLAKFERKLCFGNPELSLYPND